jgi:hypothetical protein
MRGRRLVLSAMAAAAPGGLADRGRSAEEQRACWLSRLDQVGLLLDRHAGLIGVRVAASQAAYQRMSLNAARPSRTWPLAGPGPGSALAAQVIVAHGAVCKPSSLESGEPAQWVGASSQITTSTRVPTGGGAQVTLSGTKPNGLICASLCPWLGQLRHKRSAFTLD